MFMWEVEYEREAANYLADNGQLVANLFFAMEALARTEGIPPTGMLQTQSGLLSAVIERHQIVFRRDELNRIVSIIAIQPPV
jgi:hypothetical protein